MLEAGKAAPWIETIVLVGARNPVAEYQMIAQVQQATKIEMRRRRHIHPERLRGGRQVHYEPGHQFNLAFQGERR